MYKNIEQLNLFVQKICTQIRICRIASGQTQRHAAEWFKMSLHTYADIERGKSTIENICLVADKFDIEIYFNFEQK